MRARVCVCAGEQGAAQGRHSRHVRDDGHHPRQVHHLRVHRQLLLRALQVEIAVHQQHIL